MKRILKRTAIGLLAAMIAFSCLFLQAFADQSKPEQSSGTASESVKNNGQMNLDVVFVLDASGSMTKSDPKKIAIDAYRMFVEMLDNTCGIGYVVFSHELLDTGEIVDTSETEALEATKKKMAAVKYDLQGFTDIALGLTKAKDMLTTQEIETDHREKLVILLTDGNTALPKDGRSLEESNDELDKTLLALHDRQIPVYSVGLNYNGKMKAEELQHISDETEGAWYETHSSEELLQIFSEIFGKVNQITGEEETVKDGKVSVDVTDSTVSDINLIIQSALSLDQLDLVLVNPNGETISLKDADGVSLSSTGNYTMLKITKPQEGEWTLKINGADSSPVKVTRMDYYSVYLEQQIREILASGEEGITVTDYLPKGAKVRIETTVRDQDGIVTDKNLLKTLNIAATIAKENGKMTTLTMVPSDEDGKYYVEWLVDDTAKAEIKSTVENSKFKRETIGDIYSILPISEYTNTMVNTGQYTEEYLGKVKLGDGYMGDQTYSIPEDSGNAWFTVMIIAIVIAMGIGVVIIISIIRSKIPEKALGGEVKFEEPVPEKEAPKQPYVPEKPIVMPEAKDPDLVNYELVEHDAIENLIKKGPEEAFAANADDYKTDEALEKLVKKGPDNTFAVGTDKLPEEEDYDEFGEDDDVYEDHGLDDQYEDDNEEDSGYDQNTGYNQQGFGMGGYDPNGGYNQQGFGMGGYDPNGGYNQQGFGMGGYDPNGGYNQQGFGMGGYDPNGGYNQQGFGMGGYDPNASADQSNYSINNGDDPSFYIKRD